MNAQFIDFIGELKICNIERKLFYRRFADFILLLNCEFNAREVSRSSSIENNIRTTFQILVKFVCTNLLLFF